MAKVYLAIYEAIRESFSGMREKNSKTANERIAQGIVL
jgi:hypothetical protein